jgi:lipopolysaccharide biosynthesis regulator YciM
VRVLLILAVLLPLAVVVGWFVSRPILAAQNRRRHIAELEAENERLDALLKRDADADES